MTLKHVVGLLFAAAALGVSSVATAGHGHKIKTGHDAKIKMSANDLNAACAAGGGHIAVGRSLEIKGGIANLTGECDITPGPGAKVKIINATIDATTGDFDICFFPACGSNPTIVIKGSTIKACPNCGLQIYAPGSAAKLTVKKSTLRSNPAGGGGTIGGHPAVGTNIITEGKAKVTKTTFLLDTSPVIHGGNSCVAKHNTPSTATCS